MSIVGYSYKNIFYSETTLGNRKHKALGCWGVGRGVCLFGFFFFGGGVSDYEQNENKFDFGVFIPTNMWEKGSNRGKNVKC